MKSLTQHISEKLVLTNNSKIRGKQTYNYCPKDLDELRDIMYKLIDERGNKANLNDIDVSNITTLERLFLEFDDFNGDISEWDVSNVTDMKEMFYYSKFNGDISKWNVGNVTDMNWMFYYSKFNGDISKWDVSKVVDMHWMFRKSKFTGENGDLSKWDVSNVKDMEEMFSQTKFNGDISKWNVGKVIDMSYMFFENSEFNGDLSKWNVSSVTNMRGLFKKSKFNRFIKINRCPTNAAHAILRHIRNAVAHGRIQYVSTNILKLEDYNSKSKQITMKATIPQDILISLIDEIKKTYV